MATTTDQGCRRAKNGVYARTEIEFARGVNEMVDVAGVTGSALAGAAVGGQLGGVAGAAAGLLAGPFVDALVEKATGKDLKGHSGSAIDLATAVANRAALASPGQVAGAAIDTAQQTATAASGIATQAQATAAQALATQEQARAAAQQAFGTGQIGLFVSMKAAADDVGLLAARAQSIAAQAQTTAKAAQDLVSHNGSTALNLALSKAQSGSSSAMQQSMTAAGMQSQAAGLERQSKELGTNLKTYRMMSPFFPQ